MIVGLDIAKTSGIAILDKNGLVSVFKFTGDPIELLGYIKSKIESNSTVIIERHVHFRNAKTTRSLISRLGFIEWSLRSENHVVSDIFPGKGRKVLIEYYQSLGFTKDEYDAIILIHFHLSIFEPFSKIQRGDICK